jgi:hypothetical protein
VVESGALLKRCTPKGYRGFESRPHRGFPLEVVVTEAKSAKPRCKMSLKKFAVQPSVVAEVSGHETGRRERCASLCDA